MLTITSEESSFCDGRSARFPESRVPRVGRTEFAPRFCGCGLRARIMVLSMRKPSSLWSCITGRVTEFIGYAYQHNKCCVQVAGR